MISPANRKKKANSSKKKDKNKQDKEAFFDEEVVFVKSTNEILELEEDDSLVKVERVVSAPAVPFNPELVQSNRTFDIGPSSTSFGTFLKSLGKKQPTFINCKFNFQNWTHKKKLGKKVSTRYYKNKYKQKHRRSLTISFCFAIFCSILTAFGWMHSKQILE